MNFAEVGLAATILGVFLTLYGIINNRTVKDGFRNTQEILSRIERGQEEARKEMAEAFRRMDETLRRMDEGHRESIKYLADLIRSEGDRTRQAIPGIRG